MTGKEKGKKSTIVKALPKENKVVLEGLNMVKKHQRARKANEKGTTVSVAMPMHASNVKKVK